jgi:hypothetical protein
VIGYVTVPDTAPLLSQAELARLRDRTAASLALGSPRAAGAWAGAELLALFGAPRPIIQCPEVRDADQRRPSAPLTAQA